ncbi:hypothetical protein B0A48_00119 [Cryoendolithus antarcticus]|uniref:SH3 domain-containing protein n=1 Tax=Cryoendolithus antarcticus TaxID=1507870 RepID=A0A1V8TTT7_9PEZI|nr:hypothetical protein B0A48_00119 [Cryoendolithus antarcticus]
MLRPNIVRADTIDLQDPSAPTAAEHTKHPAPSTIAPHQAAEYQHVAAERHTEEQVLADAWNMAGQNGQQDNDPATNGEAAKEEGEGEGVTGEEAGEGSDDDMMDRISSSPSIDDGECGNSLSGRGTMKRKSSQRAHAEQAGINYSSAMSPVRGEDLSLDSLLYMDAPRHLPLTLETSARDDWLSPTLHTPEESPLVGMARFGRFVSAEVRAMGEGRSGLEITRDREAGTGSISGLAKRTELDLDESESVDDWGGKLGNDDAGSGLRPLRSEAFPLRSTSILRPYGDNSFARSLPRLTIPTLRQSASQNSFHSVDLQDVLLPTHDPLLSAASPISPLPQDPSSLSSYSALLDVSPANGLPLLSPDDDIDDERDAFLLLSPRFIDSGYGGECLREIEDIDFEFVYALHTFVATVEGQANATKGDTMVLLDDSNSYWWLVRVVKDSSIGYLPAEHIETPTERLARLNKHRNIDLSQTMLGDNPEKSKNPLKKAIRRRNAKTVQFAAPTYVEASDYDYSSDEDEHAPADSHAAAAQQVEPERGQPAEVEERNAPEEANVHATRRYSGDSTGKGPSSDGISKTSLDSKRSSIEDPQLSPKLVDRSEAAPLKSRKGTPRNTDSFLKDDSIETRKISLTPGLLRDDASSRISSTESTRNNSMESLVKTPSPQEEKIKTSAKDKKKDKKGGMLSGLFKSKKKEKRTGGKEDHESDAEKASLEMGRQAAQSPIQASPVDRVAPMAALAAADTKSAPQDGPRARPQQQQQPIITPSASASQRQAATPQPPGAFVAELEGSTGAVEMATGLEDHIERTLTPQPAPQDPAPQSAMSTVANMLGMGPAVAEPPKAQRTKQRVELDDFDSPASEAGVNPFLEKEELERQSSSIDEERLSDSPVEINSGGPSGTFMHGTENIHIPQLGDAEGDESPIDERSMSTSPSLIERPSSEDVAGREVVNKAETDPDATPTATKTHSHAPTRLAPTRDLSPSLPSSPTTTTSSTTPPAQPQAPQPWNDASLRAWLDAEEVKDMLYIIQHHAEPVKAVSAEHPMMKGLFQDQRRGLEGMNKELDDLLGGFLRGRGVEFT